jgi:hypothetical protein
MLNDAAHCVVVFTNSEDGGVSMQVSLMLQKYRFRSRVIRSQHDIIDLLYPHGSDEDRKFPLPIAQSRTILQVFLWATAQAEHFDVAAVLDDDIRLPKDWGVHQGDADAGEHSC